MRLLTMLLISMVVSGYYFPFSFSVLPQLNTKMALAMLGIALVAYQGFQKHRITFSRDLLGAIVFAFIFSFICFVAADYNHTDDYSYVTYFVSFFTWLGGAHALSIKSTDHSIALFVNGCCHKTVSCCTRRSCLTADDLIFLILDHLLVVTIKCIGTLDHK